MPDKGPHKSSKVVKGHHDGSQSRQAGEGARSGGQPSQKGNLKESPRRSRHHGQGQDKGVPPPQPTKSIFQHSLLLYMEAKSRIEIWKRMPMETLRCLRLTCRRIKSEIDSSVGIPVCVDDSNGLAIASRVGIQHLRIRSLTSDHFHPFLLHPFLLRKLELVGDISPEYASYIFESCPNIQFLLIQFTHQTLQRRQNLFPIRDPYRGTKFGGFPSLTHLHVESSTASNPDFTHMRAMLFSLLTQDLKYARLKEFHVHSSHEAASEHLHSFNSYLTLFVNKNAGTLEDLTIDITQRQMKLNPRSLREVLETNTSPATSQLTLWRGGSPSRTTINSKDHPVSSTESLQLGQTTGGEVVSWKWKEFPRLKKVHLNVNKFAYFWAGALTHANVIESLSLNLKLSDNWETYVGIISGSASTLSSIQLHTVNRGNFGLYPDLRIDLSVFGGCKKLSHLGIMCKEDEVVGTNYRLTSIISILRVGRLDLAWVHLSPCQLTLLLTCSPSLTHLDLQYCTKDDSDLGSYFCRWKWLMRLGWTRRVNVMTVIDHKIRFQLNKKSVDEFLSANWKHTAFYDGFYIKVLYSKTIQNESKEGQLRFAWTHNTIGQGGTTEMELMTGDGEDGDDESK